VKKFILLIILFLPTTVFAITQYSFELDKYDSSQTVILESSHDYVILENKSALIQANISLSETNADIRFIRLFGDAAAKECERQGKGTWFNTNDSYYDIAFEPYLEIISDHVGYFKCLSEEKMYRVIYNDYMRELRSICGGVASEVSESDLRVCSAIIREMKDYEKKLENLGVDVEAEKFQNKIAQKQKNCVALGFEMGTEKNGECVLKLMELDK